VPVAIRAITRIQDADDANLTLSSGTNGYAITWDNATGKFVMAAAGGAPFADSTAIVKGSSDATKLLRFEVDGFTSGQTRVLTPPDQDGTIAVLERAQTFTADQTFGATALDVDITNKSIGVGDSASSSARIYAFASTSDSNVYTFRGNRLHTTTKTGYEPFENVSYSFDITNNGSGTKTAIGLVNSVRSFGGSAYSVVIGSQYQVYHRGTSTCSSLYGFIARAGGGVVGSGTITNAYGASIGLDTVGGTITNFYAIAGGVTGNFSNTAITNYYGAHIRNATPGSGGAITNNYGLYISSITSGGTLNYAIYTNDGLSRLGDQLSIVGSADRQQFTVTGYSTQSVPVGAIVGNDAVTNSVANVLAIQKNSTGTPDAGFGSGLLFQLKSSTTADQDAGRLVYKWATATHASRQAQSDWTVYDYSAERTVISIGANGSAGLLGFYGVTPVVKQSGTGETTGFTAGAGTGVNDDSTFSGNVGATAYRINDIVKALKNYGLLAS